MSKLSQIRILVRQTRALTEKNLLIAVVKHPISTLFRAVLVPIAFMVLLSNIKNFLIAKNGFSVGSPQPVQSLSNNILKTQKLVFVQPAGLGPDVTEVIQTLTDPLRQASKQLVFLADANDLLTTCQESLQGLSDCFAAVVFNDSPLTFGKNKIWNYTIRTDSALSGGNFFASQHSSDEQTVNLPLQVAIDNAITNSSIVPNEYMYTSISQSTQDDNTRKAYQGLIISTYGIAFFIGIVSGIYHLVGMVTTEREEGMAQLIDAMGGSPVARVYSYVLAFHMIYLPSWIVIGIVFWAEVFKTSSVLISLFWQVFNGMAITSASVFAAMFFSRAQLSGVYCVLGFLVTAVVGQIIDSRSHSVGASAILTLIFPSMNYMFMLGNMGRFERENLPTDMLHALRSTPDQIVPGSVSVIVLWVFLWIQIIIYPVMAVYVERWMHGSTSKDRTLAPGATKGSPTDAVEIRGLTKIYSIPFRRRWFSRQKSSAVVAVQDLDLKARKGQILCLLGANGSGKTTTLDMIGGLQRLTSGSIEIDAASSQLGICPQRNVLWDELTVTEHIKVWNNIKSPNDGKVAFQELIEACDLTSKASARSGTLSGGQKRKLQLACMFVGGSTVCLLDEVSSGLDPLSRRRIWNIILAERSKRTMILTTHFLDEADVLADHIAIISLGSLKCEGSAVELKTKLGGGYRVHLPGTAHGPELPFKTKHLPDETVYNVPSSEKAVEVISKLESTRQAEVYVNGPTIEDVFLKVVQDAEIPYHPANENLREALDENDLPQEAAGPADMKMSSGEDLTFLQQSKILFHKRFTILLRSWFPHMFALLIPIAASPAVKTFLANYKPPMCSGLAFRDFNVPQPLNILSVAQEIGNLQILAGPSSINQSLYDVVSSFPVGLGVSLSNFTKQFIFENSLGDFENHLATSFTNITPGAIYMGSNTTVPTYAFVGDYGIIPAMLMQNLWTQLRSGIAVAAYYTPFDSLISYFCLIQAVYPAFFALYPTLERIRYVRALQYSNGVRPTPMWFSYILFDSMFVLLIAASCTIAVSQEAPWWYNAAYVFPILWLYGIASIIFVYIVSLYASSQLGAFAFAAGGQAIMFLISLLVFVVVNTFTKASSLQHTVDATTFGLNILFPIGNVVRALLVGLNIYNVNCRNNRYISSPNSIYAYGGPILYLVLQICFLFCLLLWLDGGNIPSFLQRSQTQQDHEHELQAITQDVVEEKKRVEESESDSLRVLQLIKRFGSTTAVDDVSFGIGPGIFALLGPNGAGKSTIINLIRGEIRPDNGMVLLQGKNILTDVRSARKHLGVCPQFDALDLLTTRQHLEFYARAKGIATVQQDVESVIAKVSLTGYEDRSASKLSGGNKRKLSLAIALLGDPPVLILDEPSSSMDAASKRNMWRILMEIMANRSILLTTHSMEEADALASRAAIISKRILTVGTTAYLRKKYGDVYHVHIVLSSAPTSSAEEMKSVEEWAERTLSGVKFDSFGSYHGQIRFSVPTVRLHDVSQDEVNGEIHPVVGETVASPLRRGRVGELFELLESNKQRMGLKFYSIGATTLDQVFLNVVTENDVLEEGYAAANPSKRRSWWCL
ncbi:ABC transporter [Stipitochalara longipes BDJ]|nr:ABC transporter [Stipitochalara longipes BDJ]